MRPPIVLACVSGDEAEPLFNLLLHSLKAFIMVSSHHCRQAAAMLFYFSIHVFAIPVEEGPAELLDQRAVLCATRPSGEPINNMYWGLPAIPKGHDIWLQSSGTLDYVDDDDVDWWPGDANGKLKERSQAEAANAELRAEDEESLLNIRAGPRPFENPSKSN